MGNKRSKPRAMSVEEAAVARSDCHFWRFLAVGQGIFCFLVVFFGVLTFISRKIYFDVPTPLVAGRYDVNDLPDIEFKRVAEEYANLTGTYQFMSAQPQFEEAQKLLVEPMASRFASELLGRELHTVRQTHRSQIMQVDSEATEVQRTEDGNVRVQLVGNRLRLVYGLNNSDGQMLQEVRVPDKDVMYVFDMKVIPDPEQKTQNDYGIVITNVDEIEL